MKLSDLLPQIMGPEELPRCVTMALTLEAMIQTLKTENEALVELLGEVDRAPDDPAVRDNVRKVCSYLAALRKTKGEGR